MYCIYLDPVLCIVWFLKKLKHIMLEADYMKKNYSVNQAGRCIKANHSMVLHEIFTSLERG